MPNALDHPPDHPESGSADALWYKCEMTCWNDLLARPTLSNDLLHECEWQARCRQSEHLDSMPNTLDHPPDHPESGSADALW